MALNDRLKYLRKKANYTQQELADKLFVTRAAISKWETGKGNPNIESLKEISELFNISINDLLSSEELILIATDSTADKKRFLSIFGYSIFDLFSFILMFLPLFSIRVGDVFKAVNLFNHSIDSVIIIVIYYVVFITLGIFSLSELIIGYFGLLKGKLKYVLILSSLFSVFSLFVFIITNEPYISFFITIFLILKTLLLFNLMRNK